jgi:hypothetical protein
MKITQEIERWLKIDYFRYTKIYYILLQKRGIFIALEHFGLYFVSVRAINL